VSTFLRTLVLVQVLLHVHEYWGMLRMVWVQVLVPLILKLVRAAPAEER
jgi:predicted Na+-dependent transporter